MLIEILNALAHHTAIIGDMLVALVVSKVFLEDFVQSWGRALTVELLSYVLKEIDEILILEVMDATEPLSEEDIRDRIEDAAETLIGGDWDTSKKRNALRQINEAFDYSIFTSKLISHITSFGTQNETHHDVRTAEERPFSSGPLFDEYDRIFDEDESYLLTVYDENGAERTVDARDFRPIFNDLGELIESHDEWTLEAKQEFMDTIFGEYDEIELHNEALTEDELNDIYTDNGETE
ncbi:hypothetical protein AHIS1_p006 [Acaryochloris phage A-HIS1]|nr:hypothetical protein AHIS1_p006 [Acaryochloris phage A-HIS1]